MGDAVEPDVVRWGVLAGLPTIPGRPLASRGLFIDIIPPGGLGGMIDGLAVFAGPCMAMKGDDAITGGSESLVLI